MLRLRPAPHCRTPVLIYSLTVTPADYFVNWQQDPYSNRLARLVFPNKTREFAVEVDLVAELTVINPFDFFLEKDAEQYPFIYDPVLTQELLPYLVAAPAGPKLAAYVANACKTGLRTVDFLVGLNGQLSKDIKYLIRLEPGIQTPEETLTLLSGSCRDRAWLMVQIMRNLGLAARFVSGYLIQLTPDVKSLDGPVGASSDFTDLHAWTEVYLPGAGWVGVDPTSGLMAGEGHIPLACSAEPMTAAAISGSFSFDDKTLVTTEPEDGAGHGDGETAGQDGFGFSMTVTRIHEDPRINVIKVTPDPGVIEVNTHPVECWDDLVRNTTALYEEARLTRLGTEKFMLDGRHTGTGGGNHVVIGGATPADSPLLRRPDLLRSLVSYWHNHPALSYLFSGQFIGPTSQAPRVDESRNDQVYELELACRQVPDFGDVPPWLVDRIFRNLLVDTTGNTHRAEFCIDKLYAPESATGRLGLLEMRGFETPPHSRMSLTQQLLLRAMVARFWNNLYKQRLVRWGTEIHDRCMLPHFIKQDLEDVVYELNETGYPLKAEWFAPHLEFRFPHYYGSIQQRDVTLELRQAIEPWHVLGEEPSGGGTVRFVDSAVERLQILVKGMVDGRHVIACNGARVPLHPTGPNGQFVAGIRYRAWKPPTCLHPTIEIDSPLTFDVVDMWSGRSIGGCVYRVSHPGGRNYDRFPINAYEAESRRIARFSDIGHTPGKMRVAEPPTSNELPFTLDMRRI